MTININLLPWREERKEQLKKEFFALIGAFATLSGVILLLMHLMVANQIENQKESNQLLQGEIKKLEYKIAEITGIHKEKERLLARMEIIQRLQGNRPNIVRLFDNVVRTIPDGLYITNMTRSGKRIMLEGSAESNTRVSKLMRNIEASDWLMEPVLSEIQADEKSEAITSAIDFHLQALQRIDEEELVNKVEAN